MSAPEGFEEFVAARYQALVRTAYLLTGSREDAEDLVQTTFVRCVPAWRRIEGDPEPYVRTVLVRENISRWRRRRWREVSSERAPDPITDDHGSGSASRVTLADVISRLPPRQRAAVVLRHVEDRTERETAHLMGCSIGTVKSQTNAGLARLRVLLSEDQVAGAAQAATR